MFKLMKLESFHRLYKVLILLSLFGITILIVFLDDMVQVIQGPKDISILSKKAIENSYCELSIYALSESIFYSTDGVFYLVDCGRENYILLCLPYSKRNEMIEIYNQAELYASKNYEKKATFTGIVRTSNKKEITELSKWGRKYEESYRRVNDKIDLYTFYIAQSPYFSIEKLYQLIGISISCILIVLFITLYLVCGGFNQAIGFYIAPLEKKEVKKKLLQDANKVYLSGVKFGRGLVLTQEYLFFYQFAYSRVILLEEIKFIDALLSKKQDSSEKQNKFDLYITLKNGKKIIVKNSKAMVLFHYIRDHRKDLVKKKFLSSRLYGD